MGENMEEEISSMEKHHNSCATQQKQLHHLFPSPLLIKNQREINPTKMKNFWERTGRYKAQETLELTDSLKAKKMRTLASTNKSCPIIFSLPATVF